jgi:hypothetical protein
MNPWSVEGQEVLVDRRGVAELPADELGDRLPAGHVPEGEHHAADGPFLPAERLYVEVGREAPLVLGHHDAIGHRDAPAFQDDLVHIERGRLARPWVEHREHLEEGGGPGQGLRPVEKLERVRVDVLDEAVHPRDDDALAHGLEDGLHPILDLLKLVLHRGLVERHLDRGLEAALVEGLEDVAVRLGELRLLQRLVVGVGG